MLIGQPLLKQLIDDYVDEGQHRPLLFLGEEGCGKHSFAFYLAEKLGVEAKDITENVFEDNYINSLYVSPLTKLYILNIALFTEKEQNILLKLIEDMPSNAHIVLLAEDITQVLPTVNNRCLPYVFVPYTKEELISLEGSNKDYINYCHTPGQIKSFNPELYNTTLELVNKVIHHLPTINLPALLRVKNHLDLENKTDKPNIKLFIQILINQLLVYYNEKRDVTLYNCYMAIKDHLTLLKDSRINKDNLLTNLLVTLWRTEHVA